VKTIKITIFNNPIVVWCPPRWNLLENPHTPFISRN